MTLRVILNVKGSLVSGGSYGGSFNTSQSGNGPNGTYSQQARNPPTNVQHQLSSRQVQSATGAQNLNYSADHPVQGGGKKEQVDWANGEEEEEDVDVKAEYMVDEYGEKPQNLEDNDAFMRAKTTGGIGVKVSVDRDMK